MTPEEARALVPQLRAIDGEAVPEPESSSWDLVDLAAYLDEGHGDDPPAYMARTDGTCLLYPGRVHSAAGEPESCKGWFLLAACVERIKAGGSALYLDFEDGPRTQVARLLALGLTPEEITSRFRYIRPDEPLRRDIREQLADALAGEPTVIGLDGVTEAMTMQGLKLEDNADVAKFQGQYTRPLARTGAAVVAIDHVVKDKEGRGRWAIGAQHKLAGVDVGYAFEVVDHFGRGRDGLVKVEVTKDRPGHIRELGDGKHIAEMRLSSHDDGSVTVRIEPPRGESEDGFRPTRLMTNVSKAIEATPGIGKRALREAVKGNHDAKELALSTLLAEKYIRVERDGQTLKHYSRLPYREADETGSE